MMKTDAGDVLDTTGPSSVGWTSLSKWKMQRTQAIMVFMKCFSSVDVFLLTSTCSCEYVIWFKGKEGRGQKDATLASRLNSRSFRRENKHRALRFDFSKVHNSSIPKRIMFPHSRFLALLFEQEEKLADSREASEIPQHTRMDAVTTTKRSSTSSTEAERGRPFSL